jgi:hypothetical protein
METKHCKFCNVEHPLSPEHWYRLESSPRCKVQISEKRKKYHAENKEEIAIYQKNWRESNAEKKKVYQDKWLAENYESHKANARAHYHANKDKRKVQMKQYRESNREALNKKRREGHREYPERRLSQNLRVRLVMAIKRESRAGSAVRDLGCSVLELKAYLEARFKPGMTWENYGKVWQVDHIRPLANYDLSDRQVLMQLVHYTNLQPLFTLDNIRKSNKE